MEILTKEETLAAIREATKPLQEKIIFLERALKQNGDQISTAEARRISGISDLRTLKKRFTPTQHGENGDHTWSRVEIEEWKARKELTKAKPIAA